MKRLLLLFLFILTPMFCFAELAVPKLTGRLNDIAGVVPPHLRMQIEEKLSNFEKETTNQVVVLTVPTLQEDEISSFTQRTFETWKLGQKGKDNGVLIVIVKDRIEKEKNKSIRIHTGRGLEGSLPDVVCSRIVVDFMKPLFKEGKYSEGINTGIDQIISATKGEFVATQIEDSIVKEETDGKVLILFIGIFIYFIASLFIPFLGAIIALIVSTLLMPASYGIWALFAICSLIFLVAWAIAWIIHKIFSSSGSFGIYDGDGINWSSGSSSSSSSGGFFSGGGGDSGGGGGGD